MKLTKRQEEVLRSLATGPVWEAHLSPASRGMATRLLKLTKRRRAAKLVEWVRMSIGGNTLQITPAGRAYLATLDAKEAKP